MYWVVGITGGFRFLYSLVMTRAPFAWWNSARLSLVCGIFMQCITIPLVIANLSYDTSVIMTAVPIPVVYILVTGSVTLGVASGALLSFLSVPALYMALAWTHPESYDSFVRDHVLTGFTLLVAVCIGVLHSVRMEGLWIRHLRTMLALRVEEDQADEASH